MVNTKWFKTIDNKNPEAKSNRTLLVEGSQVLDALAEIIEADIRELETAAADYNCASWAYFEADRHGRIAALKDILTLTKRT